MTVWLMSFPAFVCLLALFALVEAAWRWFAGLGLIPWPRRRAGRSLSHIAFDEFTAVVNGNKAAEPERRRVELLRRDDEVAGAGCQPAFGLAALTRRPRVRALNRRTPQGS
ncbi:hypothetical protein [Streptomyces spectabilis]|uniref:Uncharacterized protein n=1 Tax=Streptomyces spectabilis TaxID=68270 RepID=A0A516R293_STRST|nr:hypothetical protein [Streptomyces spectabilis]QDQ09769.1 hypothetical protein FH965_03680 [Streptomyces spectabilis]